MVGFTLAGRRVARTQYRPDRWRLAEVVTAFSGIAVAVVLLATSRVDPANLNPSLTTLSWPQLAWAPLCGVLVGLTPAWLTPPPVVGENETPLQETAA
jgi:energy-coupling factor transport system permease protein